MDESISRRSATVCSFAFAIFEEKLIVSGHVTLWDPRKERVGGRERSSRQFRVRTSSGILSLANVPPSWRQNTAYPKTSGWKVGGRMKGKPQGSQCGSEGVTGGRESGAIQLSWGAQALGTKMLRKATASETTILGRSPSSSSPSVLRVSHTPSTSALDQHSGVWPASGRLRWSLSGPAPHARAPPPPPRSPPAHTPGVSKEQDAPRPPPPPRPPPADSRPSFPSAARACGSSPAEGNLCVSGDFLPLPSGASRGDRPPPETKWAARTGGGGDCRRLPRRSPSDTPPHPTPGNASATRVRAGPEGRQALASSAGRASLSQLPGRAWASGARPSPPSQAPSRPLGSGSAGQSRAVASRQLTSKCGGRVARRGAEGERLRRRPRRPDAGPGPSGWRTQGASEAQASAAAFRLSPRVRSLREGPRVPHALPSPPDNMAPGPPSRAGSPLIPSEEPGRERGWQGGADARLRRPARTRAPSSLRPDREELRRRRAAAFVLCVCVVFSLGGCGWTPPPVPRRRASEREKRLRLKRSNQQQLRRATRRGSFPHPRLSSSPRAARPLLAAAVGRSWRSRGGA